MTDYRNSDFANSAVASVLAYGSPYGAWHFTVGDRKNGPDIDAARLAALPGAVGVKTAVKAAAPAAAKTATKIRIIPEGVSGLTHRQRTILNKKLADADK